MRINCDDTKKCSLWFNIASFLCSWQGEGRSVSERNKTKEKKHLHSNRVKLRHLSSIYEKFCGKEIIINLTACGTPICVKSGGQNTTQRHQRGFSAARCLTKCVANCRGLKLPGSKTRTTISSHSHTHGKDWLLLAETRHNNVALPVTQEVR